jgi:hypothetical protein
MIVPIPRETRPAPQETERPRIPRWVWELLADHNAHGIEFLEAEGDGLHILMAVCRGCNVPLFQMTTILDQAC